MTEEIIHQKPCAACKVPQPLTEFHNDISKKDGHGSTCKECEKTRARTPAVMERHRLYMRQYRDKNGDEVRRKKREASKKMHRTEAGRKASRVFSLKKNYGLTLADYDAMLAAQRSVCAICCKPRRGHLYVDHDHKTGVVRGLLCSPCNAALGRWDDNPEMAKRAYQYLLKHSQLELSI